MDVLDSSGWIEWFRGSDLGRNYEGLFQTSEEVIVPSIVIVEVVKVIARDDGWECAGACLGVMRQVRIIPLDETLSLAAAEIGLTHRLPLADSVIYATARAFDAVLWTQDDHFRDLWGVKYFSKSADY